METYFGERRETGGHISNPSALEQRQRFQQLFFPNGIAFDGNGFVRTAVTAAAFSYLRPIESGNEGLVDLAGADSNQIVLWLRRIERRQALEEPA